MLPYNTSSAASSKNGGGILRKTTQILTTTTSSITSNAPRQVELLVFGYACKVFRDDAKAWEIDQGKHLIPWMGDANLKIDRYDVRGALSDLTPYEPPPGGYGNRLDYLTADEQRAEQLCEEERYFFLYNNEEEHILQQEEDLKRLQQETAGSSYGRVGFQYDTLNGSPQIGPNINDNEEQNNVLVGSEDVEQPYLMPKNLQVPISIQLPYTMKQHAIIEKTARFISTQGVQMEILLKAKQSNNAQFEFLAQNGILNPYYKFVLNAMKNGTYPLEEVPREDDSLIQNDGIAQNEVSSQHMKPIITVPTIKYKPSANCAYTQLISKIKGVPLPDFLNEDANSVQTALETGSDSPSTPILLQYNEHTYVQAAGDENNSNSNSNNQEPQESQVEILKNSSALALAQNYSSDSDTDDEENKTPPKPEPVLNFPIPAENLKNIIDKTATYVIKNGRQFEETLRTKSEDRFTFLIPENEFYPYYLYKITGDPDAASKEQKARKAAAVAAALLSKKGLTTPVSFSIKANDQAAATLPPALPQEPSDDDDDEQSKKLDGNVTAASANPSRSVPEHVQKAIQLVESQLMARNAQFAAAATATTNTNSSITNSSSSQRVANNQNSSTTSVRSRFDLDYSASSSKNHIKSTKTELERNAIYEQQQQNRQKELKKAEEKVKDKLAQIAREKLGGLISKDKQLQLERKRKAMAFLNQIKGSSGNTSQDGSLSSALDNELKRADGKEGNGNVSDSSEASVHSIPITSYGPDDDDDDQDGHNEFPENSETFTTANEKYEDLSKSIGPTVLVSDDDDVQLISEQKADTSSMRSKKLYRHHDERKRSYGSHLDKNEEHRRKKHKYSPQSDDESSSSRDSSNYKSKRRRHKSRHMDESYSSRKSKKSKKSSKSKKKKHKSTSGRDRSPSTISHSSRHSKQSRHPSRCRSRSRYESETDSDDSTTTTESQRRRLKYYELDDRVTYTPPASPQKSRSSAKAYSSSSRPRERKQFHYDD